MSSDAMTALVNNAAGSTPSSRIGRSLSETPSDSRIQANGVQVSLTLLVKSHSLLCRRLLFLPPALATRLSF